MTQDCEGFTHARVVDRWPLTRENLVACAVVEENVFLKGIALHDKGCACMQVD